MEHQDEMVEMESQGNKGRGETPVHRDHLARKVCMHFDLYSSRGTFKLQLTDCCPSIKCHLLAAPLLCYFKVTGYHSHAHTVYSKFTYAHYNFHLKQPQLEVYFFQPKMGVQQLCI